MDAALEDKDDAPEGGPVAHARPAALGLRRFGGQERLEDLPQLVTYQSFSHTGKSSTHSQRFRKEL